MSSDPIYELPQLKSGVAPPQMSQAEANLMRDMMMQEELQRQQQQAGAKMMMLGGFEMSRTIIPTVLFIVLSLPIVDSFLQRSIQTTPNMMLIIKIVLFFVLLMIFQYLGWA